MASRRRKIIKLLLLLLIFSGILPFVYPWGHPLLTLDRVNLPELKSLSSKLPELPVVNEHKSEVVTVYRWRDKDGTWSYGSQPPENTKFEALNVNPDTNLIQGLRQADEETDTQKTTTIIQSGEKDEAPSLMGYSAEDVSKIMQSAKEARAAMEQRYQQQEAMINNSQ